MNKFAVTDEKVAALLRAMQRLDIKESDLKESFIRGSGPGGQKVNKSSSAVFLKHIPSGVVVKVNRERSQAVNRYLARRILCERLAELILGEKTVKSEKSRKIAKQKDRRRRRTKI